MVTDEGIEDGEITVRLCEAESKQDTFSHILRQIKKVRVCFHFAFDALIGEGGQVFVEHVRFRVIFFGILVKVFIPAPPHERRQRGFGDNLTNKLPDKDILRNAINRNLAANICAQFSNVTSA